MMNNPGVMAILRARNGFDTRPPNTDPPQGGGKPPQVIGGGPKDEVPPGGIQPPQPPQVNPAAARADLMRRYRDAYAQANSRVRSGGYMRQPGQAPAATGASAVQPAGMSAQPMGNGYGTASVPIPDRYGNGGGGGY